ncbi:PqqD family peptide modification chaperone [Pseudodesulfovibrio sp. JC047]|uniref:PqqD family protein n=1 Tax=Pseudodesulfovibrio sp. JC047 TaxID=2683199 RepID=UPI0013D5C1D7|nr:PqqD family protein [Pseudodesulfovibrio sp. JC047]NDV20070.1 PqqD family peptide modification chaperone [Pseudodesulfovibrio sp. JC047]
MRLFKKKPTEPVISRTEALSMVPVKNYAVEEVELSSEMVQLAYPLAIKPWFGRLAEKVGMWDKKPMTKQVELDELGTFVWQRIDGVRSVQRIAAELAAEYEVQPREAELSVTAYIKTLGQRGIIGLK